MNTHFSFIRYRAVWYVISGALAVASIALIAFHGLKFGIDFTGGTLLSVRYEVSSPERDAVSQSLEKLGLGSFSVQQSEGRSLFVRGRALTPDDETAVMKALTEQAAAGKHGTVEKLSSNTVGPVIGEELRRNSILAISVVLLAIISFVTYAFRKVTQPVSSWKYGVVAVIALAHDVLITIGAYALLGTYFGAEVDVLFVTALLTVLGFSVHDTIVVFDRVRENLKNATTGDFASTVDYSVNQTLGRSIATSATALIVLASIILFGGTTIRWFVVTLFVGIFVGTYSSIFIASPLLVDWVSRKKTR